MSQLPLTIPKQPALKPAQDYYLLRREGIGFIEQMGSRLWTDYNPHDPGITILEALCYAITDLAYRTGWDIKDILTPATPATDPEQPFPNQPFFTARDILTVNPATPDDFRRLLIDLETVRNAWVFCKECACDTSYYAWCDKDNLILSFVKPEDPLLEAKKVEPLGLYEILLELESDPELGDLNDRKVEQTFVIQDTYNVPHPINLELRFPETSLASNGQWAEFLDLETGGAESGGTTFSVELVRLGAKKGLDVFSFFKNKDEQDEYVRKNWRNLFYLDFIITYTGGMAGKKPVKKTLIIENVTMRLFSDQTAKMATTADSIKAVFDKTSLGRSVIQRYCDKAKAADSAVESAKEALQAHRNLDEDYCSVTVVGIEEVAVCADVELKPDVDIELVQARIWFEIERYFSPPVPFYTLQELLDAGEPVEELFNGPALECGFIKPDDMHASQLKSVLRVSDIINRLMDIEGVISVNQLLLTKYDSAGNVVGGAADPVWSSTGIPTFDANKISASWLMYLSPQHQPRLYMNGSRFLFYKNGLPFNARMDEALDTLTQLRGESERPKIKSAPKDLPVPAGSYRHPDEYFPVQYSFPLAYGIGPDGLPANASKERQAQAKQLKAYLMVFEQLLGNAFAQVAHAADLFSLDPEMERTYFVNQFSQAVILGYEEIIKADFDKSKLEALAETKAEFHGRRNRFLDHIMARFGEQFSEYALLLTNLQGRQVALDRLIDDKISFIHAYPLISHDRGKAFNYMLAPCSPDNQPGIKKRVSLLMGYPDIAFDWMTITDLGVDKFRLKFQLIENNSTVFRGYVTVDARDEAQAKLLVRRAVIERMSLAQNYKIAKKVILKAPDKFILRLLGEVTEAHGRHPDLFAARADAEAMRDELLGWSSNERAIVVEHLLLRPKFPGDALYPACAEGTCRTCGDEDPYSFRLTFVMPGWTAPYNTNMEMREFADRTIRQETPSHLVCKVCWVGNDGFIENLCDPVVLELAGLLQKMGRTNGGLIPAASDVCNCAAAIYGAFSDIFRDWYADKTLDFFHPDTLESLLKAEFIARPDPAGITCGIVLEAALWAGIQAIMVKYFHHIFLYGWQFERFEDAWCKWLEVNSRFDWMEERLQERLEVILAKNLAKKTDQEALQKDELCRCAAVILTNYGMVFHDWMDGNFKAGHSLEQIKKLEDFPTPVAPHCADINNEITDLLTGRYKEYVEVSYRLWIVVNLLSRLSNTYPAATLHDWDEGSDQNPVRLGKTALGS